MQNDVSKLLSYYNFINDLIFENYVDLVRIDDFVSGSDKKIYYNNFLFKPKKIINAKSGSVSECFQIFSDYILVKKANVKYSIEYKFIPDSARDLNDNAFFNHHINPQIVSEGIISQFLASKGKYNESEFWHNKFMLNLFKIKCKKDRRLKPVFKI